MADKFKPVNEKKIPPQFFVGLGGAGTATVNDIARKWKEHNKEEYKRYKDLIHFLGFDTDLTELRKKHHIEGYQLADSDVDLQQHVKTKFGQPKINKNEEYFTQWFPGYYMPRRNSTQGAGQIRLESRLQYYRKMESENYKNTIKDKIRKANALDTHTTNFLDTESLPVVHIFCSLAGGTGSGSFLSFGCMFRHLFDNRVKIVGSFILPSLFESIVKKREERNKLYANGYAALIELEHLQSLIEDNNELREIQFHWDPGTDKTSDFVSVQSQNQYNYIQKPFDRIYLLDSKGSKGGTLSHPKDLYKTLADTVYNQIFSDILRVENSTLNNQTRYNQLNEHGYTCNYSSFGCSQMIIPDDDILKYFAHRYAINAIKKISKNADQSQSISLTKEKMETVENKFNEFRDLTLKPVKELFDDKNSKFIEDNDNATLKKDYEDLKFDYKNDFFNDQWFSEFEGPKNKVEVEDLKSSIHSSWKSAIEKLEKSKKLYISVAEWTLDKLKNPIVDLTGDLNPVQTRYLYTKLEEYLNQQFISPDNNENKKTDIKDLKVDDKITNIVETAPYTFKEKLMRTDNQDYKDAKNEFKILWTTNYEEIKEKAIADAKNTLGKELNKYINNQAKNLKISIDHKTIKEKLEKDTEELLRKGVSRDQGGEANELILDVETYQSNYSGKRLWDFLFEKLEHQNETSYEDVHNLFNDKNNEEKAVQVLVEKGRQLWRNKIVGIPFAKDESDYGLTIDVALKQEYRIAYLVETFRGSGFGEPTPENILSSCTREQFCKFVDQEIRTIRISKDGDTQECSFEEDNFRTYLKTKIDVLQRRSQPFLTYNESSNSYRGGPVGIILSKEKYKKELNLENAYSGKNLEFKENIDPKRIVYYQSINGLSIHHISPIDFLEQYYLKELTSRTIPINENNITHYINKTKNGQPQLQPQLRDLMNKNAYARKNPLHIDLNWEMMFDKSGQKILNGLFLLTESSFQKEQGKQAYLKRIEKEKQKAKQEKMLKNMPTSFIFAHYHNWFEEKDGELVLIAKIGGKEINYDEVKGKNIGEVFYKFMDFFGKKNNQKKLEVIAKKLKNKTLDQDDLVKFQDDLELELLDTDQASELVIKKEVEILEEMKKEE